MLEHTPTHHQRLHSLTHAPPLPPSPSTSDFPYVATLGGGYVESPRAVLEWREAGLLPSLTERDYHNLFSGTYLRMFGEKEK